MLNFWTTCLALLLQAAPAPETLTISSGFAITIPKQEDHMIIEFVQKEEGQAFYSYDTRCVIVYPKGKNSRVAFLIDRVDETSEVFYANAPRPSWCFKESGR